MQHAGDNAHTRATSTTSRRTLFGTTAALLGTALLPAVCPREAVAAPPLDGDAELLRLCDLFHQQQASLLAIPDTDDDVFEEAMNVRWEISGQIEDIRPVTMKGAQAQARVAVLMFQEDQLEENGDSAQFCLATLRHAAGEG